MPTSRTRIMLIARWGLSCDSFKISVGFLACNAPIAQRSLRNLTEQKSNPSHVLSSYSIRNLDLHILGHPGLRTLLARIPSFRRYLPMPSRGLQRHLRHIQPSNRMSLLVGGWEAVSIPSRLQHEHCPLTFRASSVRRCGAATGRLAVHKAPFGLLHWSL